MSEATGPQDVVAELHGLAELARISRLGVNVLDPATFTTAAATIEHLRRLDARRQQEIERLLGRVAELEAVTTVSQVLDEDRRDRDVTDAAVLARYWRSHITGFHEAHPNSYSAPSHFCVQCGAVVALSRAADEIERLRAAGDALAQSYERAFPALGIDWAGRQQSLRAWQEARRG